MKCTQCGTELSASASFCHECGQKVLFQRFCCECGEELKEGARFCSGCGVRVFVDTELPNEEDSDKSDEHVNDSVQFEESEPIVLTSRYCQSSSKINSNQAKKQRLWKITDGFQKLLLVWGGILSFFLLIALLGGRFFSLIITAVQIGALVFVNSIHTGKLKKPKKWMQPVMLVLVVLMAFPYFCGLSAGGSPSTTQSPQFVEKSNAPQSNVKTTMGHSDAVGMNFEDLVSELEACGFKKINTYEIEDLQVEQAEQVGTISEITIDGKDNFEKGDSFSPNAKVEVKYHQFKKLSIKMYVNFIGNWLFDKYDVNIVLDGQEQGKLSHGKDGDFEFLVYPGSHTISFVSADSNKVNGDLALEVTGNVNIGVRINCHSERIDVETLYKEDMGKVHDGQTMVTFNNDEVMGLAYSDVTAKFEAAGFTFLELQPCYDVSNSSSKLGKTSKITIGGKIDFKRGDVFYTNDTVIIEYHEDETLDPVKIRAAELEASLQMNLPKSTARKVMVVAMTNCQAPDVFKKDGNTLDESKFHTYSDIGDFFMTVEKDGTWVAVDESTWRVEGIVLRIYGYDTYLKANANIACYGDEYIVSNVDRAITTKDFINSSDESKLDYEHYEPSEFNSFLTVSAQLISENRNEIAANEKMTEKERHQAWIDKQFSWWDGRHEALSDLIKKNLNDSKSFKHEDVSYIDVNSEDRKTLVNDTLKKAGFSERVQIGDLFVMETFTAKNAFNATIKNIGYGIVRSSGTVILLGIE